MLGVLNKILVDFVRGERFKQNAIFCDNSHGRSRNLFGSYGRGLGSHISSSRSLNKLALLSILSTLVLSSLLLNPPVITNDEASATTGTAVAAIPNLTLTNTNTSASIDIAALDPIGSFATSSSNDSATFTLTTNNTTGYTLSIAADDDNGSLLRPVDNPGDTPDSLESISTITTTSDFSARTQEAATSYNGKWGIRPSKYVDTNTTTPVDNTGDNPVYLPSPTASNPTILDKTTTANTNNTENSYTIALGVRADHTIHAGTYSRTFKLLAVANPVSYSITFNQNTNDTVTNMPSTQSSDAITSTTVTLPSTVPVRAHYSFIGWCNLQPTTTNGIDSCTGTNPTTGAAATVYNPNGNGTNLTYGIDHTTANNATLYAMWELDKFTITLATTGGANGIVIDGVNYTTSISLAYGSTHTISGSYASGYEFSSWSTSGSISVASTSSASTTLTVTGAGTLTLNGKQSMASIQSITLATCPTTATQVYDSRDNEVYTIQKLADGKCWLLDNLRLDLTNATVKNNLTANTTNASNTTLNYLKNGGGTTSDQYTTAGVANWTSSYSYSAPLINTASKDTTQSYGSGSGKIGVYYNYCAASAGSYCYGNGTSSGTSSGNATEDICPAGWRMPTGGSSGEYQALYTAYSSNAANFKNALRTPLSGHFLNNSVGYQGTYGNFWSSTYANSGYMLSLFVARSNADPQQYEYRYYGYSVRCVLDPPVSYAITYNKNTNDTVSNMPATQTGTSNAVKKAVVPTSTPARSGYAFLGWCTTQPTTSNNIDSCSGTTYLQGSQFTPTSNGSITLYAIWAAYSSLPTMQNITASTCSASPMPVKDSRDNEVYTIQKLADGKCWLLDNLRLDLTNSTVKANLSATNTNASNTTLNYLKNGGGTTSDRYAITGIVEWTSSPNYASSYSYSDPLIATSGTGNNGSWTKDTTALLAMGQSGSGKIGVYYNYCAASAGSYCYGNGTSSGTSSGNATEDICPKGWRMPTSGSSGEYEALYTAYSSDKVAFVNALRTSLSGYFDSGSARIQGSRGYFWSSTRSDNRDMYYLDVGASNVNLQNDYRRSDGYLIRCVLGS